jgi:type II secretory pathway pseudopilin PulG
MIRLLKFLLTYKLKASLPSRKSSGFTLIELLVGLVLAFLIITPLLGFVVNMMDTDRKEQAKASSEQEIQAALDYIARDLDQSFFIYDGWGLDQIKAKLPKVEDIDANAKGEPVLVFWKRKFLSKALPVRTKDITNCTNDPNTKDCDDAFVYSLVTYYLIQNKNCNNSTWSCTARIGRLELQDALYDVNNRPTEPVSRDYEASPGLVPIDKLFSQSGSLEDQLTNWTNVAPKAGNPPQIQTLIDYIDQSPGADPNVPKPDCPTTPRSSPPAETELTETDRYPYRLVSPQEPPKLTSFYACVEADPDKTIAQVFIRGNALARIRKNNVPTYVASQSAYFPSANIQSKGRGLVGGSQSSQ